METFTAAPFLEYLNAEYPKLHKRYEDLFWVSYMGDHSVDQAKDRAMAERDAFRANPEFSAKIKELLKTANAATKPRLKLWSKFFDCYQSPAEALPIKNKISQLESVMLKKKADRKEGYIDPYTKKFVVASANKMAAMIGTSSDEKIRKACFLAREKLATTSIKEYIQSVKLRNQYARMLGYTDFYDYKVQREDGMTKKELFGIFNTIYQKTKYANKDIAKLEKKTPGILKPWNFGYMMSGDFTKEEDPFFQFDQALMRWGRSFAALGIDFKGGTVQLDLMDRKGKWNNGFCHWPDIVAFVNGKRQPGSSNFTCNVVFGQVGAGFQGYHTLFHEGGHSAHLLGVEQKDVCIAHEAAPMSMAWAETQSMFLDTMLSSIEWRTRYAKNAQGQLYPFELYKRKAEKLDLLRPLDLNGVIMVANFEREIYETKDLNREKVLAIARKNFRKYYARSEDALVLLNIPHIYSWESSGSYHGYGLAILVLSQWREYFYKKYGYIVDNPQVGKEMARVWELGSAKTFSEFVKLATGKKLSADAFLRTVTMPLKKLLATGQQRIERLAKVPQYTKAVKLNAKIRMVDGKEVISENGKSFEDMAEKYGAWMRKK